MSTSVCQQNTPTVTPADQLLEELSITPPNKINSEHQQRVVNTVDLFGLTTSEREKDSC